MNDNITTPELDVLIVTHGPDGLEKIEAMMLPQIPGVRYVVAWQTPPRAALATGCVIPSRRDIEVYPNYTIGSGANRNEALRYARAGICLLADNDLRYTPAQLKAVVGTFAANPGIEIATFMYDGARKRYPRRVVDLTPSTLRVVCTIEIAFRLEAVRKAGISFDEQFGLGARYTCGEDTIFYNQCLRKGLRGRFFPIVITSHLHPSSGMRPIGDVVKARSEGAVIHVVHGIGAYPRVPLFVWRQWRRGRIRFWWGLREVSRGFFGYRHQEPDPAPSSHPAALGEDGLRLDVLLVTHGPDGLERVAHMCLPRVDGVRYVVAWQITGEPPAIPAALLRDDIRVFPNDTVGSGANRNVALAHAEAPVVLMADNDLRYTPAQLKAVIDTFADTPQVEFATFMYQGAAKKYPSSELELSYGIHPTVTTFEIAARLASLREKKITFNPHFGVGARYECGEDSIFYHECMRKGLRGRFFPIVITSHPYIPTGQRPIRRPSVARGEGASIRAIHGTAGWVRIPVFVWSQWRRGRIRFWWGLREVSRGFIGSRSCFPCSS